MNIDELETMIREMRKMQHDLYAQIKCTHLDLDGETCPRRREVLKQDHERNMRLFDDLRKSLGRTIIDAGCVIRNAE